MPHNTLLFLCSGGGGNLRFMHQAVLHGWLPQWQKIFVISDRECPAIEYARSKNLPISVIDFKSRGLEKLHQQALALNPDIIITTIHRILDEPFVNRFENKMFNLHYSLLPSFGGGIGENPVRAAIRYGACLVGATVHRVSTEVDAGRPVTQIVFPLDVDTDMKEVMDVEFRAGCIALLNALLLSTTQQIPDKNGSIIKIKNKTALLNPALPLPTEVFQEDFWNMLK